jgi:signal transduction histidine kinase
MFQTRSSNGEEKSFMSVSVQSMPDSKNFVVVFRDLTAERKADEAQRQAEKAAAASQAKTDTMCMLSHEFRTPLHGIMGMASVTLLDLEEGCALHEQMSTIAASSKLLLTLINNVLDLNKIEANMMQELDVVSMHVEPSLRDAMLFCQSFAKVNDVKLTLERDLSYQNRLAMFTTIIGNRLRVEQILINLISNAIKFTRPGTEVTVGLRRCPLAEAVTEALDAGASDLKFQSRDYAQALLNDTTSLVVIMTIRDQGRGIPQQEMTLLFREFTQLEVSKDADRDYGNGRKMHAIGQSSGSGLGLSLVLKFLSMVSLYTSNS